MTDYRQWQLDLDAEFGPLTKEQYNTAYGEFVADSETETNIEFGVSFLSRAIPVLLVVGLVCLILISLFSEYSP